MPDDARLGDAGPPPDWQGGQLPPEPDVPFEARSPQFEARFGGDRRRRRGRRPEDEWQSDTRRPRATTDPSRNAERLLVKVMLHHPPQIEGIGERVAPEQLRDPLYAEIYAALLERGEAFDREELVRTLTDASARVVDEMLGTPEEVGAPLRAIEDSIVQLRLRELRAESDDLDRAIARAEGDAKDALIAQKQRIRDEMRALGGKGYGWYRKLGRWGA